MLSGHLHLLIWQEIQMEGKKQAFLEHLPSAMLHEECFDTSAHPSLLLDCEGEDDLFCLYLKTEAQKG